MPDRFQNTAQPDRDWWEALWPDPREVVEQLGVGPSDRVVDVCAGDGLFTLALAEHTDETVYAVDLDTDLLGELSARAAEADLAVETVESDARGLDDVLPEPVEFALLANTFHGVDDPAAMARTVRDALTAGGRFAVVNWHDRPRTETTVLDEQRGPPTELRMSPAETTECCTAAAFEREELVDLPPYHYGAVFRAV
jgi:ubiquinone/menaquinone biosynthesis C-methylase UbiE